MEPTTTNLIINDKASLVLSDDECGPSDSIGLRLLWLLPPTRVPVSICSSSESLDSCFTKSSASECSDPALLSLLRTFPTGGNQSEAPEQDEKFEECNQDVADVSFFDEDRFFSAAGNHDSWDEACSPCFKAMSPKVLALPRELEFNSSVSSTCMEDSELVTECLQRARRTRSDSSFGKSF